MLKSSEAAARLLDGLAATGIARIEDGYRGNFDMRRAMKARRDGWDNMLLSYLLTLGQAPGAMTWHRHVDEIDEAEVPAYRKSGFEPQ